MPTRNPNPTRDERLARGEQRARDAAAAVREYESGKNAVLNNMAKLRALREARATAEPAEKKPRDK
jgi:hypothetical protein